MSIDVNERDINNVMTMRCHSSRDSPRSTETSKVGIGIEYNENNEKERIQSPIPYTSNLVYLCRLHRIGEEGVEKANFIWASSVIEGVYTDEWEESDVMGTRAAVWVGFITGIRNNIEYKSTHKFSALGVERVIEG